MFRSNSVPPSTGLSIWYVPPPDTSQGPHEAHASPAAPTASAARGPSADGVFVHVAQARKVMAGGHDSATQPLLLPLHIGYTGEDSDMARLHRTSIAWNGVDMFLPGPDGGMTRMPMAARPRGINVADIGRVPLPHLLAGTVPDPSRRVAEVSPAHGEYQIDEARHEAAFLLNGAPSPSILPDRGLYEVASGKWLVGRFEEEHPLAACLCMAWIERCTPHTVRNLPPTELMLDYRPNGSSAEQAAECVRLLGSGATSLSLDGKPHGEAMDAMAGLLSVHGCGILLTQGHARVLDKIEGPLDDGYVIMLRDPDTCSARVIRDHREFWEDNAASPDVTPMTNDSVHGAGDILIVPPRPLRFASSPALA